MKIQFNRPDGRIRVQRQAKDSDIDFTEANILMEILKWVANPIIDGHYLDEWRVVRDGTPKPIEMPDAELQALMDKADEWKTFNDRVDKKLKSIKSVY